MNDAKNRDWLTSVKIAAVLFGVVMFFSFAGGIWYGLERHEEARHLTSYSYYLAVGDFRRALEQKRLADAAGRSKFIGEIGIGVGAGHAAVFVAAVLARLVSSRPSVIRGASFLIRSMSLGFLLFYVATHLIWAAFLALAFLLMGI